MTVRRITNEFKTRSSRRCIGALLHVRGVGRARLNVRLPRVNTGVNSTCNACNQGNRECTYPQPGVTITLPKRLDVGIKQGEPKKKSRKLDEVGRQGSIRNSNEDPLDYPVLTRKVWEDLFEIFKLHFATEMPFLHPTTFRSRMKQASYPRDASVTAAAIEGRVVLLGVLALTARFQSDMVSYHSQSGKPTNPLDASEYYAKALKAAFGPSGTNLTAPSIDNIQALLMLGMYQWGQTQGLSAWIYIGIAIRLAQSMGLTYEDEPREHTAMYKNSLNIPNSSAKPLSKEQTIANEVRRRTLWSCFVMDRLLCAGRNRYHMLPAERLRVQLPCSEDGFLFGQIDGGPGFLGSRENSQLSELRNHGALGMYLRLIEIFGRLAEWSCAGGRRIETKPPWDSSTRVQQITKELHEFHTALPANLKFAEDNLSAHIEKRSVTAYVSLHTMYLLCMIMLHREYIPSLPFRCKKPQGPLDEPTFPLTTEAEGFWEDSAESMCRAARDIVVITRTCQDNNVLPESPMISFAIFQAAFVGIYIHHFRHMDTGCYITHFQEDAHQSESEDSFHIIAISILESMVPQLSMAKRNRKMLQEMDSKYREFEESYKSQFPTAPFEGGGLEQFKADEAALRDFGTVKDTDKNMTSDTPEARSRASTSEANGESSRHNSGGGIQSTAGSERRPTVGNNAWSAVNQTQSPPLGDEILKPINTSSVAYTAPAYSHAMAFPSPLSNPSATISPSLAPSNGESTPSIKNPPYTRYSAAISGAMNAPQQQKQAMPPPQAQHHRMQPQAYSTDDLRKQFMRPYEQIGTLTSFNFDNLTQMDDAGGMWNLSVGAHDRDHEFIPQPLPMGGIVGCTAERGNIEPSVKRKRPDEDDFRYEG
ncbi:fungal-specific transcription factor-like protein [Calycina marina]|uniref:Fungal-specific transcription factor-like protein n=1 Tax=Calycina marina TaxID=1763456 RepID=A0A9P7YUC7_9HELO|nr:fungal-specific transcription factor-like protein [Calycina marina]